MEDPKPSEAKTENPFEAPSSEGSAPTSQDPVSSPDSGPPLDVSDDGETFFWVIQRVLWGVLRTAVIFFVIGFFIWLIWGVGDVEIPRLRGEERGQEPAEQPPTQTEVVPEASEESLWGRFRGLFGGGEEPVSEETKPPSKNTEDSESSPVNQKPSKSSSPSLDIDLRDHFPTIQPKNRRDGFSSDDVMVLFPGDGKLEVIPSISQQKRLQQGEALFAEIEVPGYQEPSWQPETSRLEDPVLGPLAGDVDLQRIQRLVEVAEDLGALVYQTDHQSLVTQSVAWLRKARQFSLVETQAVVQIAAPSQRAARIAEQLEYGESLLLESAQIREDLSRQVRFWEATLLQNQNLAAAQRDQMFDALEVYQGVTMEASMQNLAVAEQNAALAQAYLDAYQSLLKNLNNFESLLRTQTIPLYSQPPTTP